jgi:UDP-N-acetylmuramoyl-tripeptide--D-alanyl-D-alanine ligase
METKRGIDNIHIIDDTSNKKPQGFFDAIDYIKNFKGEKIIVASSLPELGKAGYSIHNNIGKKIGELCDFAIITTPFFFKEIKLGAMAAGMNPQKILFLRHPKKVLKSLKPYLKKENVILLEGEVSDKIKEYLIINDKRS